MKKLSQLNGLSNGFGEINMAEYLPTTDKDLWIKFAPEASTKHERIQELSKPGLIAERQALTDEKLALPDGIDEVDLLAWAIENYPESEAYQRLLQIDERIAVIDVDLGAMK